MKGVLFKRTGRGLMARWKYLRYNGDGYLDLGVDKDGSVYNPHGYAAHRQDGTAPGTLDINLCCHACDRADAAYDC
ncbi:hypothetical protein [Mycobacterium sp.]|uniref:hypothetical protein n=1 Tax=Mycobacterium sp. TaxID=1785 RepID=UPI003F96A8E6